MKDDTIMAGINDPTQDGLQTISEGLDDLELELESFSFLVEDCLPIGSRVPFKTGFRYAEGEVTGFGWPSPLPNVLIKILNVSSDLNNDPFTEILRLNDARYGGVELAVVSIRNIIQAYEELKGGFGQRTGGN